MSDEFSRERLPELPNAGYASARQKLASDQMMGFIRDIERDRLRLVHIVLKGRGTWRKIGGEILRSYGVDDQALDAMFDYFVLMSASGTLQQRMLAALQNPPVFRDCLRELERRLIVEYEALKGMNRKDQIPGWDLRQRTRDVIDQETAANVEDAAKDALKHG